MLGDDPRFLLVALGRAAGLLPQLRARAAARAGGGRPAGAVRPGRPLASGQARGRCARRSAAPGSCTPTSGSSTQTAACCATRCGSGRRNNHTRPDLDAGGEHDHRRGDADAARRSRSSRCRSPTRPGCRSTTPGSRSSRSPPATSPTSTARSTTTCSTAARSSARSPTASARAAGGARAARAAATSAATCRARCWRRCCSRAGGDRLPPAKRRDARALRGRRALARRARCGSRRGPLRVLAGRTETLGSESELLPGLLWRRLAGPAAARREPARAAQLRAEAAAALAGPRLTAAYALRPMPSPSRRPSSSRPAGSRRRSASRTSGWTRSRSGRRIRSRRNRYRELHALRGISFDVHQGEFFGIVGRNGSGKSTLLKIMSSIYRADGGRIRIAGPARALHRARRRLQPGADLARERRPQRRDDGARPPRGRPPPRRRPRLRRAARVLGPQAQELLVGDDGAPRVLGDGRGGRRHHARSTRCWPSATRRSRRSAWTSSTPSARPGARSCS